MLLFSDEKKFMLLLWISMVGVSMSKTRENERKSQNSTSFKLCMSFARRFYRLFTNKLTHGN